MQVVHPMSHKHPISEHMYTHYYIFTHTNLNKHTQKKYTNMQVVHLISINTPFIYIRISTPTNVYEHTR